MQEHHTKGSEYSSLPTPTTQDSSGICRDHGGDLLHELICGCPRSDRKDAALLPTLSASQEPGWTVTPVDKDGNPTTNANERWYHPETGRLMQKGVTQALMFAMPDSALLRTPAASEGERGHQPASKAKARGGQQTLSCQFMDLFPTPVASEGRKATAAQGSEEKALTGQVWLTNIAHDLATENGLPTPKRQLLGTPRANAAESSSKQVELGAPKSRIEDQVLTTNWGKFEPAIRRWEAILGRQAPEPTKPDGKDGNHRLSSKFTEWMMGLPDGWITGHNLKRNDELKLAGNGVVPQQAELALRLLLELPEREK
jgi:hypothetical protein